MKKTHILVSIILVSVFLLISGCNSMHVIQQNRNVQHLPNITQNNIKLYWFIPDGMRSEPNLFNIYKWANERKLPNIKRMMDEGSYGYSIPVYPSHTPVNFATLLTGSYPKTTGVADGTMHLENRTLDKVSIGGFSSAARKVPAIWSTLEDDGKSVLMLSIPGSTPPDTDKGKIIRGRWGGWGADFYSLNFEANENDSQRRLQGRAARLFYFGPQLSLYPSIVDAKGWQDMPHSYSTHKEAELDAWGAKIYAYVYDSIDDGKQNYDHVIFSFDKQHIISNLQGGQWGDWFNVTFTWQNHNISTHGIFTVILLDNNGFFRIRLVVNNINRYVTQPPQIADQFISNVGPMVDYVDNYPPQLIYYPEDKETFLHEMNMSFDWHARAIPFLMKQYSPDIVIHSIYSPNQMLTSRWWLGYIDSAGTRYKTINESQREDLWNEVQDMYLRLDNMVGQILNNTDNNTIIVLSSDHGAAPLNKWVRINNLLAKNGLLYFKIDNATGEPIIDWARSKAIFLKMDNIYISPTGLAGNWTRSEGPEFEILRNRVIGILQNITDDNGAHPLAGATKWENVEQFLDLPKDRVGDVIIANADGYGWNEEMTDDLEVFSEPLESGYKQALIPEKTKSMWTPFLIMGPGIKKNYQIPNPIPHIDQYPTIMAALGEKIPDFVDGKPLTEVFINETNK